MVGSLVSLRIRWIAFAASVLVAALWIHGRVGSGVALAQQRGAAAERRPLVWDRAPIRSIEDPNPVFRAVALDTGRGG